MANKTVFNDPNKAKETRDKTAEYFKVEQDPASEKIRRWLGVKDATEPKPQPVKYSPDSPWRRMGDQNE